MVLDISRVRAAAADVQTQLRGIARTGSETAARLGGSFGRIASGGIGRAGDVARGTLARFRAGIAATAAAAGGAVASFSNLIRQVLFLGNVLLWAGGAAGGLAFAFGFLDSVNFEDKLLTAQVFARSLEKGRDIMEEIAAFAPVTPLETGDLEDATIALLNAGIAGGDVVAVVKELAQVAKDGEQLGGLADALGNGFAKGKYDLEQINKFLERNVNLLPALQKVMGLSPSGVVEAISKGKVGFEEMRAAIQSLIGPGGQFFGLMERRSQTVAGLWSTLVSDFRLLGRDVWENSLGAAADILREMIKVVEGLRAGAEKFGRELAAGLDYALGAFRVLMQSNDLGAILGLAFRKATLELQNGLAFVGRFLAGLGDVFGASFTPTASKVLGLAMKTAGELLAHGFLAVLYKGISVALGILKTGLLDAMAAILSGDLGKAASGFAGATQQLDQASRENISFAKTDLFFLQQYGGFLAAAIGGAIKKTIPLIPGVAKKAGNVPGATDPALDSAVAKLIKEIETEVARITKERAGRSAKPIDPGQPTGAGVVPLEGGEDEKGKTFYRTPGRFASAVNRIAGRSTNDLVLVEATAQTRLLKGIYERLGKIEGKMDPSAEPSNAGRFVGNR